MPATCTRSPDGGTTDARPAGRAWRVLVDGRRGSRAARGAALSRRRRDPVPAGRADRSFEALATSGVAASDEKRSDADAAVSRRCLLPRGDRRARNGTMAFRRRRADRVGHVFSRALRDRDAARGTARRRALYRIALRSTRARVCARDRWRLAERTDRSVRAAVLP